VAHHTPSATHLRAPADVSTESANRGQCTSDPRTVADYVLTRVIKYWHRAALTAQKADYSRKGKAPEQDGPCYVSRISALVHVAIHDAYVGITREGDLYHAYYAEPPSAKDDRAWGFGRHRRHKGGGSGRPQRMRSTLREIELAYSAIAQAAYETLAYAYPHQEGVLSAALDTCFASFCGVQEGKDWGSRVAQTLISWRKRDSWDAGAVFTPFVNKVLKLWEHQPDPNNVAKPQYATHWGNVLPYGFHGGMEGKVVSLPSLLHESYTVRPALTLAPACRMTCSSTRPSCTWCRRRHTRVTQCEPLSSLNHARDLLCLSRTSSLLRKAISAGGKLQLISCSSRHIALSLNVALLSCMCFVSRRTTTT
jgi:hypothetical protein